MAREGKPSGEGTSPTRDVADPHPATEEEYDKIPHPGGANPPDPHAPGANSYTNDGKALPRPQSKGSRPL